MSINQPFISALLCAIAVPTLIFASPPAAEDTLTSSAGPITIHPISHASFVIEWNGKTIYVDPVGEPESYSSFAEADLVLITHTHQDHLDGSTLGAVTSPATQFVVPETVSKELSEEQVSILANGERLDWEGVGIEAVPMYNLTEDRKAFHPQGAGNGYVLTMGGTRLYIAGDTEDIPEMRALKNIDAAFVCMNLPYTMDVEHAADAVRAFKPKVVYPYHYRGKNGMSDIDEFTRLVSETPGIEVRLLKWY